MKLFDTLIAKTLPYIPKSIAYIVAGRYIAGENLSDAVRTIKDLNEKGFLATLDVLGEFIYSKEQASQNARDYIDVLYAISHHNLDANISIKPSSMGLLLDSNFCYETMKSILKLAKKLNIFVRIDMEDVLCVDKEFELLRRLRVDYSNLGIVIQAYLKRTKSDLEELLRDNVNCRLCKGIYIEDNCHLIENANDDRLAINPFFLNHLKLLLESRTFVGIATHDEDLIEGAFRLIEETEASNRHFEFQMLLGVRNKLRDSILKKGSKVRIYVPFGKDWYGYSIRRLNENPSIAGYVLKAAILGK